jgi:hypothetical protein
MRAVEDWIIASYFIRQIETKKDHDTLSSTTGTFKRLRIVGRDGIHQKVITGTEVYSSTL